MEKKVIRNVLQISGMTCASCELRIENKLKKTMGVISAKANLAKSNLEVSFDSSVVSHEQIVNSIVGLGYSVGKTQSNDKLSVNQLIGIGIVLFAIYLIINNTIGFNFIPQVTQNRGFGILFVIGLITSLHCIIMCGGINLSQCVSHGTGDSESVGTEDQSKLTKLKPSFMYNMGRVLSYTLIGGTVGALGSVISFSGTAKGIVAILSGVFMVIMGLNMLNMFPWLRKFNPRLPKFISVKLYQKIQGDKAPDSKKSNGPAKGRGPFIVGLLNGLMPCGPLQAMQIYALGTGSFLAGAGAMFFFSLGTVPLMFGFGAISSFLSSKFTKNMLKVGAVLVMILGVIMLSRGLNLSGINLVNASAVAGISKIESGVQIVTTKLESGSYAPLTVQAGIPVKWTIQAAAKDINGCNETLTVPEYGITKKLVAGDNLIEFIPGKVGKVTYTCWMGMISSTINVIADVSKVSPTGNTQSNDSTALGGNTGSTTGSVAGGCCGITPAQFAGGKIPTENIKVAQVINGQQEITVTVNNNGYTPAAFVVQKGVKLKIKFNTEQLSSCNSTVVFPELNGQLDLSTQKEAPVITPTKDITFQCSMNMLHGYIKVVDDINKVDLGAIKKEIQNYKPSQSSGGSSAGGCCR